MKTSSLKKKKKFVYGSFVYHYDLIRQERKTLSLTVTPNLNILVKSPASVDNQKIELFLKRKWFWLEKQLRFFGKYQKKQYTKEYVSGESFYYLGRQYCLVVKKGKKDKVSLTRGKIVVTTEDSVRNGKYTKRLIDKWYRERMIVVFEERLQEVVKKFRYSFYPELISQSMERRWGSAVRGKKVILNKKLIYASKECIDYVITHELCHFTHRKHNKAFWDLMNKKFPNWEKTKEKLELKHG